MNFFLLLYKSSISAFSIVFLNSKQLKFIFAVFVQIGVDLYFKTISAVIETHYFIYMHLIVTRSIPVKLSPKKKNWTKSVWNENILNCTVLIDIKYMRPHISKYLKRSLKLLILSRFMTLFFREFFFLMEDSFNCKFHVDTNELAKTKK